MIYAALAAIIIALCVYAFNLRRENGELRSTLSYASRRFEQELAVARMEEEFPVPKIIAVDVTHCENDAEYSAKIQQALLEYGKEKGYYPEVIN